jgi:predicted AAA+ superfamily ATPase
MGRIRPFINKDLVKILTGIRRSGKSVMLDLIKDELVLQGTAKSQFISINFEEIEYAQLLSIEALHNYVSERVRGIQGKAYLFFDEIQEVDGWEKCINSFRLEFDCDIYVTGSNAKLLSSEYATYLAGRYVQFVVYPFSFSEFSDTYKTVDALASPSEIFMKYVLFGGMPFLVNLGFAEAPSRQYLQDIYNSVVLKDIIERNKIRDVDLLERVIMYLLANVGKTFSAASISKYFKSENRIAAPETILNYISACVKAYLFYPVKRQELIGKKILTINEKYYVADHGLRESIYGKNNRDIEIVLENIVFIELLRRGYRITVGKSGDLEIDFIAENDQGVVYVQVSYLLASEATIEREFGSLSGIRDNYPKYVVSMDEFSMGRGGIKHLNIRDFLIMPEF